VATSKASGTLPTRTTPTWSSSASSGCTGPGRTSTTGLRAVTRRATRMNLRGLPNPSIDSTTTSVRSSSSKNCRTSLPLTSARSPADRNAETPSPRASTVASNAAPNGALWEKKPMPPAGGSTGARLAFRRVAVLSTP